MTPRAVLLFFILISRIFIIRSDTSTNDVAALRALKDLWTNAPPSWIDFDPCGDNWEGIRCKDDRVISILLPSMGLKGSLSGDIEGLSELQSLDLSYNKGLTGPLPDAIGGLTKLTNLVLVGCGFTNSLPASLGSLKQLVFLSLNSNGFTGKIPPSIGNLRNLYWLDLAENKLSGELPVSNETTPGLDQLIHTKHFHLGNNKLSGEIPAKLFSSNMSLIHLLLDNNQLIGSIPSTLGLVTALEVLRLDRNFLSGDVPINLNNLTNVNQMLLSNNRLRGPVPDLTGMNVLAYLDMSNNSFDSTVVPSWFTGLPSVTTLIMERTQLVGTLPKELFSLPMLQTVVMKSNQLNGTLDLGDSVSTQLQIVNLQENIITGFKYAGNTDFQLILKDNPLCQEDPWQKYCTSTPQSNSKYSTPPDGCSPKSCSHGKISSPKCSCAFPYTGMLVFRAPTFSDPENITRYRSLENSMMKSFTTHKLPVDSVSLSNVTSDSISYLNINLGIFPRGKDRFNRTGIRGIGFTLSNQTFKPPKEFGPYFFIAYDYTSFGEDEVTKLSNKSGDSGGTALSSAVIIGIALGGSVLLLSVSVILAAVILTRRKVKEPKKELDQPPTGRGGGSTSWVTFQSSGSSSIPPLAGAKLFTLEEVKKCTNNFSETNDIGSGGYGKVYRGTLPSGALVAIKRADPSSAQGGLEFRTEIELLSRVNHKNVVRLLGFCVEKNELMLIYEFVPNGTLKESLSGKSGVRLDWRRRVRLALGAAEGLDYLHRLVDPPIVHRDIKSNNILLDQRLNAKVSDFGLSKSMIDPRKAHMTTQVKGTMGYLDPEYYMTQRITEKSDVYSFGVVLLELITGKPPIERGRYIVREVRNMLDKRQDLYGLHELLDPAIGLSTKLGGFNNFVDLALSCVEEDGSNRPTMGEVVKELEEIAEIAGLNPFMDSASSQAASPPDRKTGAQSRYSESNSADSGSFPF